LTIKKIKNKEKTFAKYIALSASLKYEFKGFRANRLMKEIATRR